MGALSKFKNSAVSRLALPVVLSASSLPLIATTAYAQDMVLEEIIITAQKREQSAMTVPITVDTFSARQIEVTGALNVNDIDVYIPGFEAGTGITQNELTIRGVSGSNITTGGDPSVSTFYDDVYIPQAATTVAFSDMARVEVLKGPQGTLFGRNAAAGVVNLVPNQPSADFEGFGQVKAGNYNLARFEGMINMPLTDDLFMRANVLSNRRDGYIDNVASGDDTGKQDNIVARIAMLWNVTDATNLQLSYDFDKVDNAPRGAIAIGQYAYNDNPLSGEVANDVINGKETRDMYAVTSKLNHEFNDNWSMKYVVSYRDWDNHNREEEDGTANPTVYFDTYNEEDSDIFYNELQFHFVNEWADWVMGANYSKEDIKQRTTVTALPASISRLVTNSLNAEANALVPGLLDMDHIWIPEDFADGLNALGLLGFPGGPYTAADVIANPDLYNQAANFPFVNNQALMGPSFAGSMPWQEYVQNTGDMVNWGIYTDVDFSITDRWHVIVGGRYSKDEKQFSWFTPTTTFAQVRPGVENLIFNPDQGIYVVNQKVSADKSWDKFTGRFVTSYEITESAMVFGSISTGYKSGGYDSLNQGTATKPFAPENVLNYETGFKGDMFNNRLRMQLSYFYMEVDDRQTAISSMPPPQTLATPGVLNSNDRFKGVEATVDWLPLDTLKLSAITTSRDSRFKRDEYYDKEGTLIPAGSEYGHTDLNYTLTADWTPIIPFGELLVHAEFIFQEQNLDNDPNYLPQYDSIESFNDDMEFLNARIQWTSDDARYEVAAWGMNLLDNQYVSMPGGLASSPDALGVTYVTINAPLTYGVDFRYSF